MVAKRAKMLTSAACFSHASTASVGILKDLTSALVHLDFTMSIRIDVVILMNAIAERVMRRINRRRREALVERCVLEWDGKEMGDHTIVSNPGFFLISYPLISAYFASINFLVLKSFVKVVDASIKDRAQWDVIVIYVVGIIVINFCLEKHRQQGLRAFGAVYVIPIYQVLVITLGTTMGAVFYQEMEDMKPLHLALFTFSVFVTCCGVTILALSKKIGKLRWDCKRYLLTLNDSSDSELHGPSKEVVTRSMLSVPSSMGFVPSRSCSPVAMTAAVVSSDHDDISCHNELGLHSVQV